MLIFFKMFRVSAFAMTCSIYVASDNLQNSVRGNRHFRLFLLILTARNQKVLHRCKQQTFIKLNCQVLRLDRNYSNWNGDSQKSWEWIGDSCSKLYEHYGITSGKHGLRNGYRRRKWRRWPEFKSWMRLYKFYFVLMLSRKACIHLFSL